MNKRAKLKLGDLAAAGRSVISGPFGSNIGSQFFQPTGIPVIRGNNLTTDRIKFTDRGFVFVSEAKADELKADAIEGDILFTAAGTIGQVGMIPNGAAYKRYVISNKQIRFRVDPKKADPEYVYHWLASPWTLKTIQNRNTGSTVPLINLGIVKGLPIDLPTEIEEQRDISAFLNLIDAKIDLNNQINAELEAMAKLLYDYWFVQFDFPMTATQAASLGRSALKGKPYKSSGGKMVHNPTLNRPIPKGWSESTIGDTFKTDLGGTPSKKVPEYWLPEEINWLSSGEKDDSFVLSSAEHISELGLKNSAAKLLPKGTIILSIVRHLRASILGIPAATNQSVVGIQETDKIKSCFIYPYLVREIPRLMSLRTGAQQPHINKGVLDDSPLVIPDSDVLAHYTRLTTPLFEQMENLQKQNQELTQLRDWLLPMLMNGQVTVGSYSAPKGKGII